MGIDEDALERLMMLRSHKKKAVCALTLAPHIVTFVKNKIRGNNMFFQSTEQHDSTPAAGTMKKSTLSSVFTTLFAALICAGCFISVPLPGLVPISIQNMFAILSGVLLGGIQGAASVGIFLVLGVLGIPVFSGMSKGIAVLAGPTGGFLVGYFLGALFAGLVAGRPRVSEKKPSVASVLRIICATLVGYIFNYLPGIPWFMRVMTARGKEGVDLSYALKACLIPFIPGDSIKIVVTILLALALRPTVARYLNPENENRILEQDTL